MEEGITGDFALVKAWKGDTDGNLVFRGTARNFNVDAAKAGQITIAEVEELVQPGDIHPGECLDVNRASCRSYDVVCGICINAFIIWWFLLPTDQVHLPGIYVQRIFKATKTEKRIERLTLANATVSYVFAVFMNE